MNIAVIEPSNAVALTDLVDRAAAALAGARSSAEVLEARDMAAFAYDVAKRAARLNKAKQAHDELIAAAFRAQADALEIEAGAKRRLADEYDAAQARGEVRGANERTASSPEAVGVDDIGLTHKDIHEARIIRDAERADPGIVRRALDEAIANGEEPTKAVIRRTLLERVEPRRLMPVFSRREQICDRVREAITILSGLPPAHEVVGYFAGTDAASIISERLPLASAWLSDFSSEWEGKDNA